VQNEKSGQSGKRLSDRSLRTGQAPGQQVVEDETNPPSFPPRKQLPATLEQQKEILEHRIVPIGQSEVPRNHLAAPNHSNADIISREHRYENGILTDRVKALQEEISLLRKDNDLLRNAIVQKGKDTQPLRAEEYYARLFRELKAEIETWMAKQAKANASQEMSEKAESVLLQKLANFGLRGQWSAEFLKPNGVFRTWYANIRSRIQLGRHIIAVLLFDQVFFPFAFGLPDEWAKAMAWVEKYINTGLPLMDTTANLSEPQFSRVLMVHQSLGKASMNYVSTYRQDEERILVSRMTDILRLFLPKTSDQDLQKGVTKMVKKAVVLKNDMLEEQALYDCYWIKGGQNFDSQKMEIVGVEGNGPLALCTFPGLARIILNQGRGIVVHVVKASVLMQA